MDGTERTQLVQKLQKDVQDFVSQLKPKKYEDGWPEDNWEEEMEKHPIFMSKPVEEGQEVPPLVEALQQLKYDPNMNTPDELAASYKEDGNKNFKNSKYRWAIDSYTQGLKWKCKDKDLKAQLYLNRAACHFHLGNFSKALKDAIEAKSLKSNYIKAISRGALCCSKMKLYDDCISWCDEGLQIDSQNSLLIDLKKETLKNKEISEQEIKKAAMIEAKKMKDAEDILNAIKDRGVHLSEGNRFDFEKLEPMHPALTGFTVNLDSDGKLVWPVILLYPEYGITESIQQFNEDTCVQDHLDIMFNPESLAPWDTEKKYLPQNLQVYYSTDNNCMIEVDNYTPLRHLLADKKIVVHNGTPCFIITARCTPFDTAFRRKHKLKY